MAADSGFMRFSLCWLVLVAMASLFAHVSSAGQEDVVSRALDAFQHGDFESAERMIEGALTKQPNDRDLLTLLGVVLDQEKKYGEAERAYARALKIAPPSPTLLNNYGNHLVATGKLSEARGYFLKVLAGDPSHVNACVQVAQIAIKTKRAAEAGDCLLRLPAAAGANPEIRILKMQLEYAAGKTERADELLAQLSGVADGNVQLEFRIGEALAAVGQNEKAEIRFAHCVELKPGNFDALYDLGLAASRTGHAERAREALKRALDLQPRNANVLYDLAAVEGQLGHKEASLELAVRASRLAPDRADVQRLLAHAAFDLGDFADSAQAWKQYMTLAPGDDVGRREHAFAETAVGDNLQAGLADLAWYVQRHPGDPIGHYELGTAEATGNADRAAQEFDRALALKPDFTAAHAARGLLRFKQADPGAAVADLEFAAAHDAGNARILDRLGQTYAALHRPEKALETLQRAVAISPTDSSILLHLGRALENAGQAEQAKSVFVRLRELGPNRAALPQFAGLVDFLSLSPEEQMARYRAGVERTVHNDPANAEAQVRYLNLLLGDGKREEAGTVARQIVALHPSTALLAEAANALVADEDYAMAREVVAASAGRQEPREFTLDSALISLHLDGPQAAAGELDGIPERNRNGDYQLARFQVLEALGRGTDAALALKSALAAKPLHAELYRQVALLLIRKGGIDEARKLLALAARVVPEEPSTGFLRASVGEKGPVNEDLISSLVSRWPESAKIWAQTPQGHGNS